MAPLSYISLFLFLLSLPSIFASSSLCPIRLPNHLSSPTPRIVNGHPIVSSLIPHLIAIQIFDNSLNIWLTFCTGVLISPTWALSAAHCELDASFHRALLNASSTGSGFSEIPLRPVFARKILQVIKHSRYSESEDGAGYDIVAFEIEAGEKWRGMKVSVNGELPRKKSYVRVAGFGVIDEAGLGGMDRELMMVDVPVVSGGQCRNAYFEVDGVTIDDTRQVCAGYRRGGCDSCQGDSGGPMIQYDANGEPVLVGIVSSGAGCARAGIPGIYIRTAAFEGWLDNVAKVKYEKTRSVKEVLQPTLTKGQIVGIVVGAGVALVSALVLIVFIVVRRRRG